MSPVRGESKVFLVARPLCHTARAAPLQRPPSVDTLREACDWPARRSGNRARLAGRHPRGVVHEQLAARHHDADVRAHAHDIAELKGLPLIKAAARDGQSGPAVDHLTGREARVLGTSVRRLGAREVRSSSEQRKPHTQRRQRRCGERPQNISAPYPILKIYHTRPRGRRPRAPATIELVGMRSTNCAAARFSSVSSPSGRPFLFEWGPRAARPAWQRTSARHRGIE
jgi:hypothetical protein